MPTVTENVAVFMAVGLAIAVFREVYRSSLILDELEAVANAHDASVKALIELERSVVFSTCILRSLLLAKPISFST